MFLRRIGYRAGGYPLEAHLPNPHVFVDPDWNEDERGRLYHWIKEADLAARD